MNLGELIVGLRSCKADARVCFDFPSWMGPDGLHSYRGYYDQPALGFKYQGFPDEYLTAHAYADQLEAALAETHYGYKGGAY
jgi:hypothetical protein